MTEKTDAQKLEERARERELQKRGLVRAETYVANLALKCGIPVERGPSIPNVKTDRGCWVPAWVEWHFLRFPQNEVNIRQRQKAIEDLKDNKEGQLILLLESNLCGGTLYDPSGDVGTENALRALQEELNGSK